MMFAFDELLVTNMLGIQNKKLSIGNISAVWHNTNMSVVGNLCCAFAVALLAIGVAVFYNEQIIVLRLHPSSFPKPDRDYWGKQQASDSQSGTIRSFVPYQDTSTEATESIIAQYSSLWLRHQDDNPFHHDAFSAQSIDYNEMGRLHGTGYGLNRDDFHDLVTYYNDSFDWTEFKTKIQSFPHRMVSIRGLNVHFIRYRLNEHIQSSTQSRQQVEAILLLHGWPSSSKAMRHHLRCWWWRWAFCCTTKRPLSPGSSTC